MPKFWAWFNGVISVAFATMLTELMKSVWRHSENDIFDCALILFVVGLMWVGTYMRATHD